MGLSTALYTGVSGLDADGTALSVIGNDVSNSNTVGYKGAVASFADILSSSLSGGAQVGRGVELQSVQTDLTQGTLQTTSNPLDMAIQGDGFFIVRTNATSGAQYYERAGQFSLDSTGYVVDPNGNYLQGKLAQQSSASSTSSVSGSTFGAIGSINVASLNSPPKETSDVLVTANLNSATGLNTSGTFVNDPTTDNTFLISTLNNGVEVNGQLINIPVNTGSYSGPGLAAALQAQLENLAGSSGVTVKYVPPTGTTPYTFKIYNAFAIDADNNQINFTNAAGTTFTATIAPGNYASAAALATAVQTAMTKADPADFPAGAVTQAGGKISMSPTTAVTINWNNGTATPQEFGFSGTATLITAANGNGLGTGTAITGSPLAIDWANSNSTAASIFGFTNSGSIDINSTSNTIQYLDTVSATTYTATITQGTYTGTGLAEAVQTALNTAVSAGQPTTDTFTVTYNANTNSLTIDNTGVDGVSMLTTGTALPQQLGLPAVATPILAGGSLTTSGLESDAVAVGGISTGDYQVGGFDPNNAAATSDYSTSVPVYDAFGNSHLIDIYFKKVSQGENLINGTTTSPTGNTWMWYAVTPGTDTNNGQAQINSNGLLQFNTTGALVDVTTPVFDSFNFSGGVTPNQQITFDFGQIAAKETITQSGSGLTGITQYGAANSVLDISQDGYSSGGLQSISISQAGVMSGTFSNGQTQNIAQIVLARFNAETQLLRQGGNLFAQTTESGDPIISAAGTSGIGTITADSLESSNVNLATEFVNMITVQRGYEANAKVVTVTDQLLSDLNQAITT